MFGKFIVLFALAVVSAQAGLLAPVTYVQKETYPHVDAIASTHESVVRSFDGTVAHHSKAVDTPYSSVRKSDTRINNNVYTPALAKTVTYAAPLTKTLAYAAPVTKTVAYSAPVAKTVVSEPQNWVYSQAPTHYSSEPVYTHSAPTHAVHAYQQPAATTTYQHTPNVATYAHNDNHLSAYGSSQTVHYSPANMVSHMSFDGFGTHWGF